MWLSGEAQYAIKTWFLPYSISRVGFPSSWLKFQPHAPLYYSQKRAEATPDQTVSDSGPTWESQIVFPKKSQQKPYFFLIDFDWVMWLHPKVQRSRMEKGRYTQRATLGLGVSRCQVAASTEITTSFYSALPYYG